MVDFHSHILPSVDDGSKSIEESNMLLGMLSKQGVKTVFATSHYYADRETPNDFLARRNAAYKELAPILSKDFPEVLLGAEVRFYSGISRMSELCSLRIENTKLLLLEMPFARWTEYTVNELLELSCSNDIKIVLAHIERYLDMQDRGLFEHLHENGILMQTNASFFTSLLSRGKALRMLCEGMIDAVGSDCHSLEKRPPRLADACAVIQKKCGSDFLNDFIGYSNDLLVKYQVK